GWGKPCETWLRSAPASVYIWSDRRLSMADAAEAESTEVSAQPTEELSESARLLARREAERQRTPSIFPLPLARLSLADPFQWLRLGWTDFKRCPRIGLFYGLCFFAMGHALLA